MRLVAYYGWSISWLPIYKPSAKTLDRIRLVALDNVGFKLLRSSGVYLLLSDPRLPDSGYDLMDCRLTSTVWCSLQPASTFIKESSNVDERHPPTGSRSVCIWGGYWLLQDAFT
jgi:hypothetical protein